MPFSFCTIEVENIDQFQCQVRDGKYAVAEIRIPKAGTIVFRDIDSIEHFTSCLLEMRRKLEMPATA